MEFTLVRDTGIVGSISKLDVYINNEKVGKIANNAKVIFELPHDGAEVKVGMSWVKSRPVKVSNGQKVVIKGSILGSYFVLFGMKSFILHVEQ
ncbi:MAG: hypothetical protein Q4B80_03610 [Aerococcaceae bacterium]|nr:hypothetical protein [Aerococcaceae bacterium]